MTAHLTDVRSYLLKPPLCFFFCFLIFKYKCKNIICYRQHTAITFATAHCFSILEFLAVTVENVASPVKIAATALLTFTFNLHLGPLSRYGPHSWSSPDSWSSSDPEEYFRNDSNKSQNLTQY